MKETLWNFQLVQSFSFCLLAKVACGNRKPTRQNWSFTSLSALMQQVILDYNLPAAGRIRKFDLTDWKYKLSKSWHCRQDSTLSPACNVKTYSIDTFSQSGQTSLFCQLLEEFNPVLPAALGLVGLFSCGRQLALWKTYSSIRRASRVNPKEKSTLQFL